MSDADVQRIPLGSLVTASWSYSWSRPYSSCFGEDLWRPGSVDGYVDCEDRFLRHDQVGVVIGSREQTKGRGSIDHLVVWNNNVAWFANDKLLVIWDANEDGEP